MSETEKSKNYVLWKDEHIGKPPEDHEFILDYYTITRALLSFDINLEETDSFLDNETGILVNDQPVPGMNLPPKETAKSLKKVERKDLDITSLLRTNEKGEKNKIQVNYRLGFIASKTAFMPGFKAGKLNLEVMVYYPYTLPPVNEKYCMWCGRSCPADFAFCCYCGRAPPLGGPTPKKCNSCPQLLPHEAYYCEKCGHKQPDPLKVADGSIRNCVNCHNPVEVGAKFCPNCAYPQS